jgi:hypothetical protein
MSRREVWRRSRGPLRRWSRDADACRDCGTASRRHYARGYCKSCWERRDRQGEFLTTERGRLLRENEQEALASTLWVTSADRWAYEQAARHRQEPS